MTVTQLINEACGESLQGEIRQATQELASVEAGCNIHWLFRPSVVDTETGMHGLRWLIARILLEAEAIHPQAPYSDGTPFELRKVYIAKSLTTEEITSKVRSINGFDKYPDSTIIQNLSVVMRESGQVASIQMTSREDNKRECKRPRLAWYLIAE